MTKTGQTRAAAALAAEWWTERLLIDDPARGELDPLRGKVTPDQRDRFTPILADKIEAALKQDGRCYLTCDYDPWDILLEAVREAGIECRGCMFSARGILPQKHGLRIEPDKLTPKEGYGNWTAEIEVTG